jgi:MSHA pilin protein MshC
MVRGRGFTLVELIGVIAIAGILVAVAAPRFFSASTFETRGYLDGAKGFLRYAQKLAVARHATLFVQADDSALTLCAAAAAPCAGGNLLPGPGGQSPFRIELPGHVTQSASASSLSFDSQGRPGGAYTLTVTGDGSQTVTVEAETGYVH